MKGTVTWAVTKHLSRGPSDAMQPSPVELKVVTVSCPALSAGGQSALVRDVLKALLFLRGLLPAMYEDLKAQTAQTLMCTEQVGRRRPRPPGERRLTRAVDKLDKVLDALSEHSLSALRPAAVVFLVGSSATRPREAFEIQLPPPSSTSAQEPGAGDGVSRRVTRSLVASLLDAPAAALRGSRVTVLLRTQRHGCENVGHTAAFVPKQRLHPAWHKATVLRTMNLRLPTQATVADKQKESIKETHVANVAAAIGASCIRPVPPTRRRRDAANETIMASIPSEGIDAGHIWHQCRVVFKAPPPLSTSPS
jgi:hypothetical protein